MRPASIDPEHFQELASSSGIDPQLAALNFTSIEGNSALERLFISPAIPRLHSGLWANWWRSCYAFAARGGWWCSGLDPLHNWREMKWGCYKPNRPRLNQKGKPIKYEHPPRTATRIFCLRVTLDIWQQISQRYGVPMPENIVITAAGEAIGFWQWVVEEKIPVIICEGAKKAAALLSYGYAAIALPGITSGYRAMKNFHLSTTCRQLIPDLLPFTQKIRTFYICFDYETQPKTIQAVNNAIAQIGKLLEEKSCSVKVIRLPGIEKGVDEFIVAKGAAAFEAVYQVSVELEIDIAKTKPHNQLTYSPALTIDRPYLEKLPFPRSGLIGIKSAKGTGKTTALLPLVEEAKERGQPILLLTHRIQLGKFLCEKIGVEWIENRGAGKSPITQTLGLCIDSLWKVNPEQWQGAIVILDEVEQCLWHLLNSSTCQDKRVIILKAFQQLISTVLQTGGLAIVQDADLSDLSLDYLKGLSGIPVQPWVVVNEWKPEMGWDINFIDSPNPTLLIQQLELDLIAGKKCYVTTDSRSGRYSSETIESYIKQRLEQFARKYPKTLVISSQTIRTPGHEAGKFLEAIDRKTFDYNAVFVTPSLGTGVSIDGSYFDRVYGIFLGVIPDWEARQALARVRANVPRIVWCAKRGIGSIGSGSKNYRALADWYQENHKESLALMSPLHKADVDLPLVYDLIHLRIWAKFAARVNASISMYRQSTWEGLIAEGHQVNVISDAPPTERLRDLRKIFLSTNNADGEVRRELIREIVKIQKEFADRSQKAKLIKSKIKKIRSQAELESAAAVAAAVDIDREEYEHLLGKRSLTCEERNKIDKYVLKERYGVEVTPQLKQKDDRGYYSQLLLHYYLTHDRQYFQLRDEREWNYQLYIGEGKVFLPDLNTYSLKVEFLRSFGIVHFIDPNRKFQENDRDLIDLKVNTSLCSKQIQRSIGICISEESSIKIFSQLLSLLGLKLQRVNLLREVEQNQNKVYQIDVKTLNDGREEIFRIWDCRDKLTLKCHRNFSKTPILV